MTETTPAQLGKKRTRRSQPRVFRHYGTIKTIETNLGIQIATNATNKPSKARMALVTLIIAAVFVVSLPAAQAAGVRVGRNIDIRGETGADRQVDETSIAVDPVNADIIVAGAGDLTLKEGPPWEGYYRSTDGGATWSSRLIPGFPGDTSPEGQASPLKQFDGCIDPSLAFDRSENLYFAGSCGKVTASGAPAFGTFGVFVAKFTGDGAVYSGAIVVEQGHKNPDFPKVAVDATGGANDGNVYLEYGHDSDGQTLFTRSTDGGQSFSNPIQVPGPGLNYALALDAAGNVYVATAHCTGGGDRWRIELFIPRRRGPDHTEAVFVSRQQPRPLHPERGDRRGQRGRLLGRGRLRHREFECALHPFDGRRCKLVQPDSGK